jgi:hypothetical protein
MKTTLSLAAALLVASTVSSQGSLTTATGYGDFADAGRTNVQGVAQGTAIGPRGLRIAASSGGRNSAGVAATGARASTSAGFEAVSSTAGAAVVVQEQGGVNVVGRESAAAGTSDSELRPSPGAHGLAWRFPAREGTNAVVSVSWRGAASSGAATGATVDVDGDGRPDFRAGANGNRSSSSQAFRVTAGPRGFHLGIATQGAARQAGPGQQAYHGELHVSLRTGSGGGSGGQCTFTSFGPQCGGELNGRGVSGNNSTAVGIHLSNAAPNALAALVVGSPMRPPVQLPGSRCELLVTPRVVLSGRTDGSGNAQWGFGVRGGTIATAAFQAITVSIGTAGVQLASSDGLLMDCQ